MTPQELRFAALKELGVVDVDETPSAEQDVDCTAKYGSLHAMLLQDGLVTWTVTEDIPTRAEQPLIWMLAFACASSEGFGAPLAKRADLAPFGAYGVTPASLGEKLLRKMLVREYVSLPAVSEYF